ncbi:long-chain acyl-CoA synthetase [Paenibacillus sp. yr247]|uniref:long-chain-fatty-acid--CoA ligase n=1 Tax=Paenibacillus sp. yr247 TaxID=1761880 RepID=UPI0008869B30|nr:long-chain-fatty-acid--CoA ligase [Paenibacillus sp. yr247]SDN70102.1 long-chain acyl-CoA synthetase [Paenibacillus sp. yr247]
MSLNLNKNLEQSVAKYAERSAYVFGDQSVTYEELNRQVQCCASGLSTHGIGKGDKVAILLGNAPEFIIAYYGILHLGAAVVPINPTYTSEEIAYILNNSQAKAVIAIPGLEPVLTSLKDKLPTLKLAVYTGDVQAGFAWKQLMEAGRDYIESALMNEDDLAVILYTSGTTGKPKGAMLSHRNMATNAHSVGELFELSHEDRIVTVLPMFHVYCMTVCLNGPIAAGATILVVPKFSPADVVKTIREQQATMFAGVPTMYNFLLQFSGATAEDFASIRKCAAGGASLPVEVLYKFEEKYKVHVNEGYGLSEASPVTAFNPLRGLRKPGSIGVDIPNVTNKVVDTYGNEVPRGEVGELIVQGPNVMMGYLGMPEATEASLRDGWLYTGDLAKMDEDGYIFIVDRLKDMIIVGGFNVYPREVEEVLYQHPAIFEAAVVGVPDQNYGETVKAFVVCKDESLTMNDLLQFCQDKLAKYKLPKIVEFMSELPKNSSGKTMRRVLREQA